MRHPVNYNQAGVAYPGLPGGGEMKRMIVCIFLCSCFLYSCYDWMPFIVGAFYAPRVVSSGMGAVSYIVDKNMSMEDINNALIEAKMKVTLDDTYRSAFGVTLKDVERSGDTGYKFTTIMNGTKNFQNILKDKGMPDASHYILTSIDAQMKNGYVLLAVVYRPYDTIKVVDKYDRSKIMVLTSEDRGFYEPYRTDANGEKLDTVVDWAGVSKSVFDQQKYRAVMMTLAANKVFEKETNDDYWMDEKRWVGGQYGSICNEKDRKICNMGGVKK